jgi:hypothetical protein
MTLSAFVMTGAESPRPGVLLSAMSRLIREMGYRSVPLILRGAAMARAAKRENTVRESFMAATVCLCCREMYCKERCLLVGIEVWSGRDVCLSAGEKRSDCGWRK